MARAKKTSIDDRITTVVTGLTVTVPMPDSTFQKFHYSCEFQTQEGDDVNELTKQAWDKVNNQIQAQIDESLDTILEEQKTQKRGRR